MSPKRLAFTVFFASVAINAALGITAVFSGSFGETQGKVLFTSLSISAASVMSLAMFPARDRNKLGPIPAVGIVLSGVGFVLLIILVWSGFGNEILVKSAFSILVLATSSAYASLVGLAIVRSQHQIVVRSGYFFVTALSALIIIMIWGEPDGDFAPRMIGAASILLAAVTVSIPVLHRINRRMVRVIEVLSIKAQALRCIRCGSSKTKQPDRETVTCEACQTVFRAEILV